MDETGSQPPRSVSDSELDVLKVLWRKCPLKVGEIRDLLARRGRSWAYNTVQTLLSRLEAKGFAASEKKGRAFLYMPRVSQQTFVENHMADLANRVGQGQQLELVMALVKQGQFSRDEIQQFRALLDEIEHEDQGE